MSQSGNYIRTSGPGAVVQTLTGNTGGAVGPTGGNIDVVGSGTITVTGNPGTSTLTISSSGGSGIETIDGDLGSVTGTTITIESGVATQNSGSSVYFNGSGTTLTLHVTDGLKNTIVGELGGNATISGISNTGFGYGVFSDLTTGQDNTALGWGALAFATDAINNVALGTIALGQCTSGQDNVAIGFNAAFDLTDGTSNIAIGSYSLQSVVGGDNNVAIGHTSGNNITTGSYNIAVGYQAGGGLTTTDSSNICIGNAGVSGDTNVIRIGTTGSGSGEQDNCYIAGIDGVDVGSVASVLTNSGDHIGTAVLTAGTNITITPGSNTITIDASGGGGGITWVDQTTTTVSLAVDTGYSMNNGSLITGTLPSTAAFGSVIAIVGYGSGGWSIAQNSGQTIHFGNVNTTTGVGGSLSSTNRYDCVELLCTVADTHFVVRSSIGNITYV